MIGSLAQGLVGVIVDEVAAQGGRRIQQQRDGVAPYHHQQQHQQQRPQHTQQQQLPPGPLASLVESITLLFNRAVAAAVAGLQYLLLFEALLVSAILLYGALYWLVMPLRLHDRPIFFDYSGRATTGGATGTVDFLAQHTQWDPSPLTTVERLNTKVLKAGQHYKVGLELQMPTSYTNRRVGVFMVHTTLLDGEDNELATSARPAMLPHTSALRKGVVMVFSWPLHVLGLRREEETVLVDCVDFYEENALHPLTKARVTVSSGRVQFYRSSIHITPQLKGLPWLMQHWFYSTLAAGVLFIASLELMAFGFCYVFFFLGVETTKSTRNTENTNGGGGVRSYGDAAVASVSSHTGRLSSMPPGGSGSGSSRPPETSALSSTTGAPTGRGFLQQDDEGLRRRRAASASVASAASATAPATDGDASRTRGASSASSVKTESAASARAQATQSPPARKQAPSTLPPGVQAYQRGARYIVQAGGGGGEGRPVGSSSTGLGAGGGGGSGSGSGSGSGAYDPRSEGSLREEDLDAAAMASWRALDGNATTTPRGGAGTGTGTGGGGGGRAAAQGLRAVDPASVPKEFEPLHQPHGVSTVVVDGEGAEVVESEAGGAEKGRDEGGAGPGGLGSSPDSRDEDNW